VSRKLIVGIGAAGAVVALAVGLFGRNDPRPAPTLAELAAHNYRVLSKTDSRALVRYAERVHGCLVAHGAAISEPVTSRTRITMRAPGASARELAQRIVACDSSVGPPPAKASLQARAGQVVVYLPKRCLLDPTAVDGEDSNELIVFRAGSDRQPPSFAGLSSATTCIPGPVRDDRPVRYHLRWRPAKDNVTPARKIVYEIYRSARPRGERFSAATYTTAPGATAFTTPLLSAEATYYFVVRARDRAGNRDLNRVERAGVNICE
jgi:hypothetical protein